MTLTGRVLAPLPAALVVAACSGADGDPEAGRPGSDRETSATGAPRAADGLEWRVVVPRYPRGWTTGAVTDGNVLVEPDPRRSGGVRVRSTDSQEILAHHRPSRVWQVQDVFLAAGHLLVEEVQRPELLPSGSYPRSRAVRYDLMTGNGRPLGAGRVPAPADPVWSAFEGVVAWPTSRPGSRTADASCVALVTLDTLESRIPWCAPKGEQVSWVRLSGDAVTVTTTQPQESPCRGHLTR